MDRDFLGKIPRDLLRDEIASNLATRDWSELRQTNRTWNDLLGPMIAEAMQRRAATLVEQDREASLSNTWGFFGHVLRFVARLPAEQRAQENVVAAFERWQLDLESTPGAVPFDHEGHVVHRAPRARLWLPSGRMTSRVFPDNRPLPNDRPHLLFPEEHAPHLIMIGTYLCLRGMPRENLLSAFPTCLLRWRNELRQAATRLAQDRDPTVIRLADMLGRPPVAVTPLYLHVYDRLVANRMRSIWGYGGERLASISRPNQESAASWHEACITRQPSF
jgi:hypothetical protein